MKSSKFLAQHKELHIPIYHVLNFGKVEILIDNPDCFAIKEINADVLLLTAMDPETAQNLARALPKEKPALAVLCSQPFLVDIVANKYDYPHKMDCYQYFAQQDMLNSALDFSLPIITHNKEIHFKPPTSSDLENISEHFDPWASQEYYNERAAAGKLFGAFIDNKLVGVIGFHIEGGSGLLFIKEEFRRMGIAQLLEEYSFLKSLEAGEIPYGHVDINNIASQKLQEKMGLKKVKGILTWLI